MIRLSISEEGQPSRLVTFNKTSITVGRAAECDLVLGGKGVSGQHCRISQVPGGHRLEDLGSTNGTYVNRKRLATTIAGGAPGGATSSTMVSGVDEIVIAMYRIQILEEGVRPITGAHAAGTYTPGSGAVPQVGAPPPVTSGPMPQVGPSPVTSTPVGRPPATAAHPAPPVVSSSHPVTGSAPTLAAATAAPSVDGKFDDAAWTREWDRLDKLARDWIARGRDRSLLLRGKKLEHARRWLTQSRGRQKPPKKEHKEFIVAGARALQMRWIRNVTLGGLAVGAIGVTTAVILARQPDDPKIPETPIVGTTTPTNDPTPEDPSDRLEESNRVAALAESLLESDPIAAGRLAIEALRRVPQSVDVDPRGCRAERVLRRALAESRGRPLPDHGGPVVAVALAPDATLAATVEDGPENRAIRLWELERSPAAVPQMLRGHVSPVKHLLFSEDGRALVSAGDDEFVLHWDIGSGERPPPSVELGVREPGIAAIALSADGRWLLAGARSGKAKLFDLSAPANKPAVLEGHTAGLVAVELSRDGTRAITASDDGTAMVWRIAAGAPTGRPVVLEGHTGAVLDASLSRDGKWALTGGADRTARLWEAASRVPANTMRVLATHTDAVTHVGFSPDSRFAVTAGADDIVARWKLWVPAPEAAAQSDARGKDDITALLLRGPTTADGRPQLAITGSRDGFLRSLDLDQLDKVVAGAELEVHRGGVRAVDADASGQWVITGGADARAQVLDLAETRPAGPSLVARGHTAQVLDVAVVPGGARILTASADGTAKLWDATRPARLAVLATLAGHQGRVNAVAVSPGGRIGATGGEDGTVRLWGIADADPAKATRTLAGHTATVNELEFTPDGAKLVSISADHTVRIWDMRADDPNKGAVVLAHPDEVTTMAVGQRLLFTGSIQQLNLWDHTAADPAAATRPLGGHDKEVRAVAIAPQGRWAASADSEGRVLLWDISGEPKKTKLRRHEDGVDAVAFSPDPEGKWLATGSKDKTIRLWPLASKHPEDDSIALTGHTASINDLAWSADGQWLFSASNDGSVRAWPVAEKDPTEHVLVMHGHSDGIRAIAVESKGDFVASASLDFSARVWPLRPEGLVAVGCLRLGRGLSPDEWSTHFRESFEPICGAR